jgi:hypothetical protein
MRQRERKKKKKTEGQKFIAALLAYALNPSFSSFFLIFPFHNEAFFFNSFCLHVCASEGDCAFALVCVLGFRLRPALLLFFFFSY